MGLRRWLLVVGFALLVLPGLGGCSWVLVRQAPPEYAPAEATGPPKCTSSLGPPISDIWDAIAIGGGLVATGSLSLTVSSLEVDPAYGIAQLVGGAASGAVFGASAAHGFSATRRCRRLRDRFQRELYRRTDAAR